MVILKMLHMFYYHIGNNNIVEVAKSQVGTTSGSKYWTWYGFNKKVNWCAIFVSWCANESGMLDDSSVPKFSLCTDGENWYKKNNRWKDKTYVSEGEYAPGRVLDGSICRGQNGGAYRFGGKSVSYTNL